MGWSHTVDAGRTLSQFEKACVSKTGSQNVFQEDGKAYFLQVDSTEHTDGAITGVTYEMTASRGCRRVGAFRIEPDGKVVHGPTALQQIASGAFVVPPPPAPRQPHAYRSPVPARFRERS